MKPPSYHRLTLLRHATAMPDQQDDDHARTLAPNGRAAAAAMGQWLKENHTLPDMVLCSTATRTRETLAALQLTIPTLLSDKAYLASTGELLAMLQEMDDATRHIMLVGHNPGIHGLAALLARDYVEDMDAEQLAVRYPTCGLVSMTMEITQWRHVLPHSATVDLLRFGVGV